MTVTTAPRSSNKTAWPKVAQSVWPKGINVPAKRTAVVADEQRETIASPTPALFVTHDCVTFTRLSL